MTNASLDSIRRATIFAASVLAVCVLYWGRDLLIPLALAILITFLLNPIVSRLCKWRVPKTLAVLIATGATAALIIGAILLLSSQVVDLTKELPKYQQNLVTKVKAIRSSFDGWAGGIKNLQAITTTQPGIAETTPASSAAKPEAAITPASGSSDGSFDFVSIGTTILSPILSPITTIGVVFIMVCFLLIDSEIVNRRMHWIGEHWRLGIPLDAIDEALTRVGGYLRTQLLINAAYGGIIAIALALVGVPNAILWGVLSGVMRYVPFIGAWIAASLPIMLSVAIFPGWGHAWAVLGSYVCAEAITYGLLEPMLFGHSTGVSTIGVVIATFFWGWLWGPVGLILAMPLTACLVVIGRHIPLLRTLSVLLSSDAIESNDNAPIDPNKPFEVTSYILKMRS